MSLVTPATQRRAFMRARDIFGPGGVLPISRSTFYAWCAEGRLPPGTKLSNGVRVWALDDIITFAQGGV